MSNPPHPTLARLAILSIFGAMTIYGANFAVTRSATQHGLSPADLVALRFGVAGPLLLPAFLRLGLRNCAGIGWKRGIVLALTSGAPMTMFMNTGLAYAPAAHGAALGPGTVTTIGVIYGMIVAGRPPSPWTLVGLAAILTGLASIAVAGSVSGSPDIVFGDLCFLATGLIWGSYPILLQRWRVEPLTSAAVVAVLSLAYLPVYLLLERPRLFDVPWGLLLFQGLFQGVLNLIVGLWLWGFAVKTLGVARTQLFPPLIPVLGTLFAIPILGELPGLVQALGLVLIVGGIVLALSVAQRRAREQGSLTGS